ncbi:MAG: hypothetical protein ABIG89_02635 [Candidatus Woesearchaeota archaeon]
MANTSLRMVLFPIDEGSVRRETNFFSYVNRFTTVLEEVLRDIRTVVKSYDEFPTLDNPEDMIRPDLVQGWEDLFGNERRTISTVATVLSGYLKRINPDDDNSGDPIIDEVSRLEPDTYVWQIRYGNQKKRAIDEAAKGLEAKLVDRIRTAAFELSLEYADNIGRDLSPPEYASLVRETPILRVNGNVVGVAHKWRSDMYRKIGVAQGIDPALLYELAFKTVVKAKGWDSLGDKQLIEALEGEGVPVKMFTRYTGRNIQTEEPITQIRVDSTEPDLDKDFNSEGSHNFEGQSVHYIILPTKSTYAQATSALVTACQEDRLSAQPTAFGKPRGLTFLELYVARKMNEDLWNTSFDTCMGIAYSKDDNLRFKVSPVCKELIEIPADYNIAGLPVVYADFDGVELDRSEGTFNTLFTSRDQLMASQFYDIAFEGNSAIKEYAAKKMFDNFEYRNAFGIWLLNFVNEDQIRGIWVYDRDDGSSAGGNLNLLNYSRFLRVAHLETP